MMGKSCFVITASIALAACSGGELGEGAANAGEVAVSEADLAEVQKDVLHELNIGQENIRFVRFSPEGGEPVVLVRQLRPAGISEGAIEQLVQREGADLTLLEIFLALAPENETPHEALVSLHEEQALRTRGDASVRRVSRGLSIAQWTSAGCTNYTKSLKGAGAWNGAREKVRDSINIGSICPNWTGGDVRGNCTADFTDAQIVAACNNGPGAMQVQMSYRFFDTVLPGRGEVWLGKPGDDDADVPAQTAVAWIFPSQAKAHNIQLSSMPVNVPLNQFFHMRSGAWGLLFPFTPQ